jgi:WD40 repeat protein
MRLIFSFVLGLIFFSRLPAQQTTLTGPVEAFTFDALSRSVRAVIGVPGATSFGPALFENIDLASMAPGQSYGLVIEGGKCLFVSNLGSTKISSAAIAGVAGYPDGIAWSAGGSLAILYSRSARWVQTISGFPGAPAAGAVLELSSLDGPVTAVTSDAPGKQIAFGVSGDRAGVYQASGDTFTLLGSMANPISLSFSTDGQTLYALDGATLEVTAITVASHAFQTLALTGMANPVALQSAENSQNQQILYVAGGSDKTLRILDAASGQTLSQIALNFQPTSLDAFGGNSFVLRYRSQTASPLWLFSSLPQPGAYFVPAVEAHQPEHAAAAAAIVGRTP